MEQNQSRIYSQGFFVAAAVCVIAAVYFGAGNVLKEKTETVFIDGRINPNVEPAASIERLPSLGMTKAKASVEYRESFGTKDKAAFQKSADLENVRGIGPKTAAKIERYLRFD